MVTDLLILQCDDAAHLSAVIRRHVPHGATVSTADLETTSFPLRPSRIQELSKCRTVLVLLSPRLLDFLERRPGQAFSLCRVLEPSRTVAAFCGGACQRRVLCYHKAPLMSYDSWEKFVVGEDHVLPEGLMEKLQKLRPSDSAPEEGKDGDGAKPVDVIVVPSVVTCEDSQVYLIFSDHINGLKKVCVNLCGDSSISVPTEKINPYVLRFTVPDYLIQCRGTIQVTASLKGKTLTEKILQCPHFYKDSHSSKKSSTSSAPLVLSLGESIFEQQLDFLCDVSNASQSSSTLVQDDSPGAVSDSKNLKDVEAEANKIEDSTKSLLDLCSKYGLDELKFEFLNDSFSRKYNENSTGEEESMNLDNKRETLTNGEKKNNISMEFESFEEEFKSADALFPSQSDRPSASRRRSSPLRRSLSLPCTIGPATDSDMLAGGYLDMSGTFGWPSEEIKPHQRLLEKSISCEDLIEDNTCVSGSLSNHIYMSMKFPAAVEDNQQSLLKSGGLSSSQQELLELMHNFKNGVNTISQVEQHFQEWHKRHRTTVEERDLKLQELRITYEKLKKVQSFGLPDLKKIMSRKPKKKESKDKMHYEPEKGKHKHKTEKQENKVKRSSKVSDTSTSSGCSASSELSTVSHGKQSDTPAEDKDKEAETPSALWFNSPTSGLAYCPLFPQQRPPPPPPFKPPPTPANRRHTPYWLWGSGDQGPSHPRARPVPVPLPRKNAPRPPPQAPPSPDYIEPLDHWDKRGRGVPVQQGRDAAKSPKLSEPTPSKLQTVQGKTRKTTSPDARRARVVATPTVKDAPPTAVTKPKRNPHSPMFYITRRSSSDPQLRVSELATQHVYMELVVPAIIRSPSN